MARKRTRTSPRPGLGSARSASFRPSAPWYSVSSRARTWQAYPMPYCQPLSLDDRLTELGALVNEWTREELQQAVSSHASRFGGMLEYHLGWRDENLDPLDLPAPSGKK